jgi:hypothetical protein
MSSLVLCTHCGATTVPRRVTPGPGWITLVLLIFFVVPGVIYWLWRHTSTYEVCAQCGNRSLIPPTAPVAQTMVAAHPSVAAALAQSQRVEEQKHEDTRVGAIVLAVIVVLVIVVTKITSCR